MNVKQKLDAGQNATILLVGDSLTGDQSFMYPYRVAELLAAKYPCAKVLFVSVIPNGGGSATTTVVQDGGPQVIKIVRDGIPGSTSFRANNITSIYYFPIDFTSIFLGVNDAVNWYGSPTYTPQAYMDNISYMGRYAKESYGCDVMLITPAWSEDTISQKPNIAHVAVCSRYVARKNGWLCVDARRIFEDHYSGTGNAGQGTWFADPSDHTHFGREGHYAIADEFMKVIGF